MENIFGVATRLDEKYVYFVYVKGYATGKAIINYINFFFFIKI